MPDCCLLTNRDQTKTIVHFVTMHRESKCMEITMNWSHVSCVVLQQQQQKRRRRKQIARFESLPACWLPSMCGNARINMRTFHKLRQYSQWELWGTVVLAISHFEIQSNDCDRRCWCEQRAQTTIVANDDDAVQKKKKIWVGAVLHFAAQSFAFTFAFSAALDSPTCWSTPIRRPCNEWSETNGALPPKQFS